VSVEAAARRKPKKVKRKKLKQKPRCTVARKHKVKAKKAKPKARRSGYSFEAPADRLEVQSARRRKAKKKALAKRKPKRKLCAKKKIKKPLAKPHATPPPPVAPAPAPPGISSPIAVYSGQFGRAQAERLLWRAGFGPSPGWSDAFASFGLEGSVNSLVYPQGPEMFVGAEPVDNDGVPIAPEDLWGHDHAFWLDRMVRTTQPLVQRMALIWHDWFATSNDGVGNTRMMLDQYELFRTQGRGSFQDLLRAVTIDHAMLLWLNGIDNRKGAINENYGREVMELFTLGADRGAYTETDVRQLARAFSGWRADWVDPTGWENFRFDPKRWDNGQKTVFGQTGAFNWEDAYRMCVAHPMHPSFFVNKLWSYFIPTPPSDGERVALEQYYVGGGYQIAPVVRAILLHPSLYEGPRMIKPPVVFNAGMLRALARPVDRIDWIWLSEAAGQVLFRPPDVAGWDDNRWLDTSTTRGRWDMVRYAVDKVWVQWAAMSKYSAAETPTEAVDRAFATWAQPEVTPEAHASLLGFSGSCLPAVMNKTQQSSYRAQRQNALLQLIASSPDLQTS
jgi:hypothetical protein